MGSFVGAEEEYDIVIAGGGTAACIVAGRLAEADPDLSILLIERGPNNLDNPDITTPAMYWKHLLPDSKTAIFYKGIKEQSMNGREAVVPAGGVLGGGSSINFMMYTRGQACDYDSWNTDGWDSEALIPLAKKLETFHPDGMDYDKGIHGSEGPIGVSFGTYGPRGPQIDIMAGAEATGVREINDMQDFKTANGIGRWRRYVSPDGKRQDTAHRYVHPLMASGRYPKLRLLVETTVSRVVMDGTRARGVECVPTAAGKQQAAPFTVTARKLVVVSAGALGTPQVLERSGIGGRQLLLRLDIPLVADLPGVGEEYQDHNLTGAAYEVDLLPSETMDAFMAGGGGYDKEHPMMGWNGIDLAAKMRPSEDEVAALGPDFGRLWDRDFRHQPDRPLMLLGVLSYALADEKDRAVSVGASNGQYITMGCYTAYPYSRGSIHIASRDPRAPPLFRTGFLSHPADVTKIAWAYKKQRDIMRRTNMFLREVPARHPRFPPGSRAALLDRHPVPGGYASAEQRMEMPPIEYDAADDAAIEDYIRNHTSTTWHSMGTCKMAPRERGGVVDKHLNVHGLSNLKIADLSICPENVAANTNNTALIVGEKAAFIIGRELGLKISAS